MTPLDWSRQSPCRESCFNETPVKEKPLGMYCFLCLLNDNGGSRSVLYNMKFSVQEHCNSAQEPIEKIELHAFGDASGKGVAAAAYAVFKQPSTLNKGLVAAKARLAKQGPTIPRRELVSGHMAVKLLSNVQDALQSFPMLARQQRCLALDIRWRRIQAVRG